MKTLIVVLFVSFQTIISSAVLAWSPLDGYEAAIEKSRLCQFAVASSEEGQEGKKKEETEEEPDCD
ncbi:MAG: hypothetical protein OEN02_11165 [Gammaproteobacteria bacterium]|nr:hypothetical protein [Gammaproteobacteria bacterium]MDH3534634.1 hypothetical protein [Gammaproteobacteria bacterium]